MPELTSEEARWLKGLAEFDMGNRNVILGVFACFGVPATYLDIGCGTGAMVKAARALGVDALGVDILPHDEPYLIRHNLNTKLDLFREFEVVTSVEVVEHTEPSAEGEVCDTLVRHVKKDGRLILTAAPPGQNGDGHINCQPQKYWIDRLQSRGLTYRLDSTQRLQAVWRNCWHATPWISDNLMVFLK